MGRARVALWVALLLGCVLPAPAAGQEAPAGSEEAPRGLPALLAGLQQATARVATARELLEALNATASSSTGEVITLTGAQATRGGLGCG